MHNSVKIIINSGKRKQSVFLVFSLKETLILSVIFGIGYFIIQAFTDNPMLVIVIPASLMVSVAILFLELPNKLTVIDIIKLFNNDRKQSKHYYYTKDKKVVRKEIQKKVKKDKIVKIQQDTDAGFQ